MLATLSPATLAWLHRLAVLGHIGAVVVWFGAVAYYLLILRPALRAAGLERRAQYALLAAIRARLRRVVGGAVVVLVITGFFNAWLRGFLGGGAQPSAFHARVFHVKLGIATLLVLTFLLALPALRRVKTPKLRGRLFVLVHVAVLMLGALAAAAGVILAR
ncbi:MAG TPA: hypothetical protein VFY16_04310 [Gemmatimonadaceae bacterium]|nr:hypothetical protein [Gemmatimonadaceae bacterium]